MKNRRTTVDEIFDHLHNEILTLRLLPGDKISEAEIAAQFGVSRQPVRDAFSRLDSLDLLVIRPQRATTVRRFSHREITKARFVRAAIEVKVLHHAAQKCTALDAGKLFDCIERQHAAVDARDFAAFGKLDYEFHKTLCDIAAAGFAFEAISAEKAKVDRLCILELSHEDRLPELLQDHAAIATAVKEGNGAAAEKACLLHLSRLDTTISEVSKANASYFEA